MFDDLDDKLYDDLYDEWLLDPIKRRVEELNITVSEFLQVYMEYTREDRERKEADAARIFEEWLRKTPEQRLQSIREMYAACPELSSENLLVRNFVSCVESFIPWCIRYTSLRRYGLRCYICLLQNSRSCRRLALHRCKLMVLLWKDYCT